MTGSKEAGTDLQQRVALAEERNQRRMAGRVSDMSASAANAVKDHPFASLATGVAAGILLASFLPKRAKGRGSAIVMGVLADFGVNIAQNVWKSFLSARQAGQGPVRNLGDGNSGAGAAPADEAE